MPLDRPKPDPTRPCPHCGRLEPRPLPRYSREGWIVAQCGACGFVHLANPPGHAALSEAFAWEKGLAAEETRRKAAAPLLYGIDYATRFRTGLLAPGDMQKYVRWFGPGGNVLDVGCATGGRIRAPFTPFGIEVSKALAAEADAEMRARGGYCLHGPGAEAIWDFPETFFDGIVMRSYLEHEEAPLKALRGARRALKPSGRLYVKVPNYGSLNRMVIGRNWCGFRLPDHVNYFTLASLRGMAAAAGFRLRLKNPWNLWLDDNIHALLVPV
ncbi:MAG TPA: class I SAM-dependent methyltransferase [Paracoccaceae bacterium]|nr:class I SAM-dependent methyltransferase [Paracoccaceae bacterium]